ncbi:MAG: metallophosphoesterase family protein [Anaerolineae bacterium]|nr:metallophosphoesterase family protein [Anaerolineae bacterium]
MRTAIFSDVHGNLTALEAILADIKQQSPDLIVFAGDLCLFGPQPAECIDRIQAENISAIYGNQDEPLCNQPPLSYRITREEWEEDQNVADIVSWTRLQLTAHQRAWLHNLPFQRRISPTTQPKDDLFIVHANPHDVEQHIYPPEEQQKELYGEIRQPDDDLVLNHLLGDLVCGTVAFGHVHVPNSRQWQDTKLVNISSVSLAQDGDTRAKYGLFTWNGGGGWQIEHRYVAYDLDKELALLAERQMPDWEKYSRRLKSAHA